MLANPSGHCLPVGDEIENPRAGSHTLNLPLTIHVWNRRLRLSLQGKQKEESGHQTTRRAAPQGRCPHNCASFYDAKRGLLFDILASMIPSKNCALAGWARRGFLPALIVLVASASAFG